MRNKMPPVCYQFGWDDTGDLGVWAVDATAPGGERCVEAMVLAYDEYDSNSKPRDPSTWAPTGDYWLAEDVAKRARSGDYVWFAGDDEPMPVGVGTRTQLRRMAALPMATDFIKPGDSQ